MSEMFQRLWALQELDLELKALTANLADLPRRIRDLKKAAEDLRADLEQARHDIVDRRKRYKLSEVDLKTAEEKVNTYSVQLYSAKTNEQYKAFLKEIETQKKLKSGVEDRMIVLMEETEQLDRKVKQEEKSVTELDVETARRVSLLESEEAELKKAIAEREEQRARIAESLAPELLKRYERIRHSKGGIAVSTARRDRCTRCLSPIPAQRVIEIQNAERLYTCEACGRILIGDRG